MTGDAERLGLEGRFTIERRLGAGGFGVVYQAYDRAREAQVALKVLRQASGESLYRFKREFRALADLVHPNLVGLYELLCTDGRWFFTMELVDGVGLLQHLRGACGPTLEEMPTRPQLGPAQALPEDVAEPRPSAPLDYGSVRTAFHQMADALAFLHDAGKLHCDIKPSNVLVTADGRVVVLDFGLLADVAHARGLHPDEIAGTPAYMSPEQATGGDMTAASDVYSLGVMMYETLTGRRPFAGGVPEMLRGALPVPPSRLVPATPGDLDTLCLELLHFEPPARPQAEDVQRRLASGTPGPRLLAPPRGPVAFRGREHALGMLREALEAVEQGRTVAVIIEGRSGLGKTSLVGRFLDERTRARDLLVLAGRCYESEAVPYKALDSLIDGLSQHLKEDGAADAWAVPPKNLAALARLFPVLRRVDAVAAAARDAVDIPDPAEQRRRASAALRGLFARLAERRPVVLFIDDLQWGDSDSAGLIYSLLSPPEAPPLLVVGCQRSEDAAHSPLLRVLRSQARAGVEVREIVVGELTAEEAESLARALLGPETGDAEWLARECGGSPLFLGELVRHWRAGRSWPGGASAAGRIEALIEARLDQLSGEARRLLETIAVAGRPIEASLALRAAAVAGQGPAALAALRAGRLVGTRAAGERGGIVTYHDRIRQTVLARLSDDARRQRHFDLARALEAAGGEDPYALCVHYDEGGVREKAVHYATVAADRAMETLAFERAATLYRFAAERQAGAAERWRLQSRLGDALANAGHGPEAADAYLEAAGAAPAGDALELRRRAAENLLRSGHIDRGLEVVREVLAPLGLRLARTPQRALVSLLALHLRLAWRGLGARERPAGEVSKEELIRVDTCWSVAMGLSFVDNIRGAEFQKRHLLLALKTGEPYRLARALAGEAGYVSTAGSRGRARTQVLLGRTAELAQRVGHPHTLALASFAEGIARFQDGRFKETRDACACALDILRERCTGVAWELDTMQFYELLGLLFLGELRELSRRVPALIEDARARGDLFAELCFTVRIGTVLALAADDPAPARRQVHELLGRWSQRGFHTQHYYALMALNEIDLYTGAGMGAWDRVREGTPALRRSLLLRVQSARIRWREMRGRAALSAAATAPAPERFLRAAEQEASALQRERAPWGDAPAALLCAGVAATRGRLDEAHACLETAIGRFEALDMALYAAAARRRRGELVGGDAGRALIGAADEWMEQQGIRNPRRMTEGLAPGFAPSK